LDRESRLHRRILSVSLRVSVTDADCTKEIDASVQVSNGVAEGVPGLLEPQAD